MANNINSDINKFDGKYLKCIVSKYNSSINYLANSGSLIILQPPSEAAAQYVNPATKNIEEYNRNYIYLGDEFIASGYGFLCKNQRDRAEKLINEYDDTIKSLNNKIDEEGKTRNKADEEILNLLKNYVATKGGSIEETQITINGVTIPTKDIILYGEEAKYYDIEIESVKIYINYDNPFYIENINEPCVSISKQLNSINKFNEKNILYIPLGVKINYINIEIVTKDNDSDGIKYLQVLHNNINNENDKEGVLIKYNFDGESYIEDPIDSNYNTHKFIYSRYIENGLIINDIKENVIKNIYLYIKSTPTTKYKFYPQLAKRNINLLSIGNIIKEHKIPLNIKLDIYPQYFIKYNFNDSFEINDLINDGDYMFGIVNDFHNMHINLTPEQRNNNNEFRMNIAIPSNLCLQKFYLNNGKEIYNLTGAVKIIKRYVDNYDNYDNLRILWDIYKISLLPLEGNIEIDLKLVYKSSTEDEQIGYINDEEFNNLYWLNYIKHAGTEDELADQLNKLNSNGTDKNI